MAKQLSSDEVNVLTDYLVGTAKSVDDGLRDLFGCDSGDLDQESLDMIDNDVFICSVCGWACSVQDDLASGGDDDDSDAVCLECDGGKGDDDEGD
jgi:hypothetical protein